MTTASAMLSPLPPTELPSTQLLQDVLYDILAVGVDSDASASTTSAIEVFLHEHARSPKPRDAFVQFFREQGLSWKQARSLNAEPEALPPLKLVPPTGPKPAAVTGAQSVESALDASMDEAVMALPVAQRARGAVVLWAAMSLLAVTLGVVFGVGYGRLQALTDQLEAVQSLAASQAQRLSVAQQRVDHLEASAREQSDRVARVEHQSALITELLGPAASPQ